MVIGRNGIGPKRPESLKNMFNTFTCLKSLLFEFLAELANLLNKLHESFVVLAAQLQAVHEAVKVSIAMATKDAFKTICLQTTRLITFKG